MMSSSFVTTKYRNGLFLYIVCWCLVGGDDEYEVENGEMSPFFKAIVSAR